MVQYAKDINNNSHKYFWSPAVKWERKDNEIRIEIFSYKDYIVELFPKFYFISQKGVLLNELISQFPDVDSKRLYNFIQDLIKKRILVSSLLTPQEIYYPQNSLFNNKYSEKIKYDEKELESFREKQLQRIYEYHNGLRIVLDNSEKYPEWISKRRTYRIFDTTKKIQFETFSNVLSVFRQIRTKNEIRYYYASAGGLYPVDVYIYVKKDRIEDIDQGLYYYSPVENSINLVDNFCVITKDAHYFTNQSIFDKSAFSIFMIYNSEVTMPKYGGLGYFYACIDSGIMISTLTSIAELFNIGLCSIGDMNFTKIKNYFKLNEFQVHLHTIEAGLKPTIN